MTQENKDRVYAAVKDCWGRKTKTGFNWVAAKFGRFHGKEPDEVAEQIISCVQSKKWQVECPVHLRVHEGKKSRVVSA